MDNFELGVKFKIKVYEERGTGFGVPKISCEENSPKFSMGDLVIRDSWLDWKIEKEAEILDLLLILPIYLPKSCREKKS